MTLQREITGATGTAEEQAMAWFARRRSGEMTQAQEEAFQRWVGDSEHRSAFQEVSSLWTGLEGLRADPAVLAMRERALEATAPRFRAGWRAAVVAASVALGVLATLLIVRGGWLRSDAGIELQMAEHRTRVGQKSAIALTDGTMVVLDADSSLRVGFTPNERRVELLSGRAFFQVAKESERPFSVVAGGHVVTALGTEFDVEIKPAATEVTLVSGRLRVQGIVATPSHAPVEMSAGHRLIAADDQRWILEEDDTHKSMRWLQGQLVFDQESLADIAAVLNRYSSRKIVITDPAVAHRSLSAVLTAGDIDVFLQSTRMLGLATVEEQGNTVELSAP